SLCVRDHGHLERLAVQHTNKFSLARCHAPIGGCGHGSRAKDHRTDRISVEADEFRLGVERSACHRANSDHKGLLSEGWLLRRGDMIAADESQRVRIFRYVKGGHGFYSAM